MHYMSRGDQASQEAKMRPHIPLELSPEVVGAKRIVPYV